MKITDFRHCRYTRDGEQRDIDSNQVPFRYLALESLLLGQVRYYSIRVIAMTIGLVVSFTEILFCSSISCKVMFGHSVIYRG